MASTTPPIPMHDDDLLPFPLLAIVGQAELKLALVMSLINPLIGGVLLIGPYGVGKTTSVRALLDILPVVNIEIEDADGNPQIYRHQMRLVELPLNARLEDLVGSVNERIALEQHRLRLEEGILAKAHRNLLYVDEINLLDPVITNSILDAAAQGRTLVRRGAMMNLFSSRFVLIGSMNPEEGGLRPQIMDRFGLRVWVAPLAEASDRIRVYQRMQSFRSDPAAFRALYREQTADLRDEIATAREILPYVTVSPEMEQFALALIQMLRIPSHRAEIALLEAARARAASDFRNHVTIDDIHAVAHLALRQRASTMIEAYQQTIDAENERIRQALTQLGNSSSAAPPQQKITRLESTENKETL